MFNLNALNGITTYDGLKHCVLESLFSDAKCYPWEAQHFGTTDKRGYWGQTISVEHGSKLWLLLREKATLETEQRLINYIKKALEWVNEYGSVEIETELLIDRINFIVRVNYKNIEVVIDGNNS